MSDRIPDAPLTRHGYYEVRPLDVLGRDDLLFVDVRPIVDLSRDFGHIEGVRQHPGADVLDTGLPGVDPNTPVVLVCNNGRETRRLVIALVKDHGFTEVYHLVGGMLRWTAEERPTSKAADTWSTLVASA